MIGTHSLGDWEKKFDLLFTFRFQDGAENAEMIGKAKNVRDFIREALLAQKEGFRREIEGFKRKARPVGAINSKDGDIIYEVSSTMFNDLLTKLDTNGI